MPTLPATTPRALHHPGLCRIALHGAAQALRGPTRASLPHTLWSEAKGKRFCYFACRAGSLPTALHTAHLRMAAAHRAACRARNTHAHRLPCCARASVLRCSLPAHSIDPTRLAPTFSTSSLRSPTLGGGPVLVLTAAHRTSSSTMQAIHCHLPRCHQGKSSASCAASSAGLPPLPRGSMPLVGRCRRAGSGRQNDSGYR